MNNYTNFLKGIKYFETLDENELIVLNKACQLESYEGRQVVIAEGDKKEKFYIILEGSVNIFKDYYEKDQSFLAGLIQGDMFGELSFVDDNPRSATVVTMEASRFLTINKDDFMKLLSESANISFSIMKWMAATIRKFNQHFIGTIHQRNRKLEQLNIQLKDEIQMRKEKERQLHIYKNKLEEKVETRTKDLKESYEKLKFEIDFRKKTEAEKEKVIFQLEDALGQIKTLSGLFPVCIKCKKIRDKKGYWHQLENYLRKYSETEFRDCICDECSIKHYPQFCE